MASSRPFRAFVSYSHADAVFADFLQQFGAIAATARSEEETAAMARLFWFTVEFGLVKEGGRVKVYGSGLISSHGDAANALGDRCDRRAGPTRPRGWRARSSRR